MYSNIIVQETFILPINIPQVMDVLPICMVWPSFVFLSRNINRLHMGFEKGSKRMNLVIMLIILKTCGFFEYELLCTN